MERKIKLERNDFNSEKSKKTCGIYAIKNIVNGKFYVGSTSKNFNYRWNSHIYELNKNTHNNNYLQKAWNKYSMSNFVFQILEIADKSLSKADIFKLEQKYLDELKPFPTVGYNLNSEAKGGYVKKLVLNDDAFKNVQNMLKEKGIECLYNNMYKIIEYEELFTPEEYANFLFYMIKNIKKYKPAKINSLRNRAIKRPHIDIDRSLCNKCQFYNNHYLDDNDRDLFDYDYCNYLEIGLPDINISQCNNYMGYKKSTSDKIHKCAYRGGDANYDDLCFVRIFNNTHIDDVIEDYLNGKLV